jgi:uracil-DNA glycosylase
VTATVTEPEVDVVDVPQVIRGTTDGANCYECPFSKMGRPNQAVTAEGSERPIWIVVGEGPGQNEVIQQRPFVGQSGRMVSEALYRIGVRRESVWITNATLCQPPSGATDGQKKKARECCAPRLKEELLQFPGRPILALGAIAAQGFCGDKFSITAMAGAYHEVDLTSYPWRPREVIQGPARKESAIEVIDRTQDGGDIHPVIPSTHPAAILRGGTGGGGGAHTSDLGFWSLCYDAQKVNLLARGRDIQFTDDIEFETEDPVRAEKLVEDFVRHARTMGAFACDTETYVDDPKKHSALQAAHAKLSAIGLATTERAISVAWTILTPRAKRLIGAILSDLSIKKTFHNGLYDVPVLNRHGFTVQGPREDTLLLHHSAFPGLPHDLQRVTTQFYCITPWKAEYRHGEGELSELLKYNARDTLATARDEAPLQIAIKKSNAEKTYEVDMAMARAAAIMHVQGVPIDREVNEQLRTGFKAHIDRTRGELIAKVFDAGVFSRFKERLAFEQSRRMRKHDPLDLDERIHKRIAEMETGGKPFKFMVDSGDHVVAFLKACGVPLSIQTVSGRISTKKDILESFAHYPEVRALLTYRENAKLLNTFVERLFDRDYGNKIVYGFADENDRVHPRWSVHKITGRWGSEAPGSQNWPKADKKKGRPNLRSQVVARHGRAFVAFDAAQLEARIIALLSGDPFLLDIFHNKKDIHSEFARIVWPDFDTRPVDERKVLRDMIKRPEYGAFYGGAVDTLWKAVVRDFPNVTIGMIGKMVATMKTKMPGVTAWHQRMMRTADEVGEVRSALLGRRRCFPLKQFELSEVVNFPVQSTGADLINLGLMDVMPKLPETTFPILQIHDAVVFECDEDDQDLVKKLVIESFTREVTYEGVVMNFPVDARAGKTWAEVN